VSWESFTALIKVRRGESKLYWEKISLIVAITIIC